MTSSVDTRRQRINDGGEPSIPTQRLNSTSIPGSLARLRSNQQNKKPVLSDAQRQSTSKIGVESNEGGGNELEGRQQEEAAREGEKQRQEQALRQVRKDLEDKTGFGSYEAYLESIRCDPMYVGRSYTEILDGCFHDPIDASPGVDIVDVSNEDLPVGGVRLRCENLSASELCTALCQPPPDTRAQIVLWQINTYTRGIKDFLDVLGVGLRLDPCFFEALRWRKDENEISRQFLSKNILCMGSIGTSVSVARSFELAQGNPVPVVLIAGPMLEKVEVFNYYPARGKPLLPNKAIYDLVGAAPLYGHYNHDGRPHLSNTYIRALFTLIKSDRDSVLSSGDTLSACIIPLLQIEIAICKGDLDNLRELFDEFKDSYLDIYGFKTRYRGRYHRHRDAWLPHEAPESMYRYRTRLRSWIEYFQNENCALMGLSSLIGPNVTEGLFYPQIKERSISIAKEASRLEAEIRDYLQLQGSKLALEESKKSIQLSNHQINEGKRVKIFTVLAFFYVPLNLATSIFGMNVQQLNSNGTSIEVFLGTTAILLLVTGVTWYSIEGVQDARGTLEGLVREPQISVITGNHSIFIRLYLIWWLGRNYLFGWMIRSGAGWRLLMNKTMGFQPPVAIYDMTHRRATEAVLLMILELLCSKDGSSVDKGGWLPQRKSKRAPSPAGP